ncbi:hypothetical protein COBT_003105, partial [Conglomerata obtusa]
MKHLILLISYFIVAYYASEATEGESGGEGNPSPFLDASGKPIEQPEDAPDPEEKPEGEEEGSSI